MSKPPPSADPLVVGLDAAVQAHLDWTRRIIRCAVLRAPPDADVVDPHAHTLCRFGGWFSVHRGEFEGLDPVATERVETVHRRMHDAMRTIFTALERCEAGSTEALDAFESTQAELISLLAQFKTMLLSQPTHADPLTGLPLRHGIEGEYARLIKETARTGGFLYVAMIDIDHFKRVNDTYGHPAGDAALRHLCDTLRKSLRGNEPLYRYGGEEFCWLMKCRSPDEARKSARRALASVGTTPIPIGDGELLRLTITLGLARAGENEAFTSVLHRADQALYQGKRSGRNCFVFAEP